MRLASPNHPPGEVECFHFGQSKSGRTRVSPPVARTPMSRARLLERLFEIDIEQCSRCSGTLKIIAAIEHPP